jgi:hypothetical protein
MRRAFRHWFWGRALVVVAAPLELLIQTAVGACQGFREGVCNVRDGLRRQ